MSGSSPPEFLIGRDAPGGRIGDEMKSEKIKFISDLSKFATTLTEYVSANCGDWSIKGFIDVGKNIYTISSDTKIVSKILEIQLFPKFLEFAHNTGYDIVPAEKQNWYPDLSFVKKIDPSVKFAVDIKTSYRLEKYKDFCSGFTLGSHGEYFRNRCSTKNIQFPYGDYMAHISLGIIYTRAAPTDINETEIYDIDDLTSITSVIGEFVFFVGEKWQISSDRSGSGNTANIGSIDYIPDLLAGNGVFAKLGEEIFDEYWTNRGILRVPNPEKSGEFKKLTKISEFLNFKNMNLNLINKPKPKRKTR